MRDVTDPRTGIQTTEKYMTFMPQSGELKVYCDGVAAVRARIQRLGALPTPDFSRTRLPPPPSMPGDLATVFVPENNPRYASLVEWSRQTETDARLWKFDERRGICVAWNIWDDRRRITRSLGDLTNKIMAEGKPGAVSIT